MERTLDVIKWGLIGLLLLVLAWAALAATKWLPRPTDVQRKALLILDQPPTTATGRHNAFDAIWLWQYDIPAADLETVANADLLRYRESRESPFVPFVSKAEGRYRKQELPAGFAKALCSANDEDCLAKIRAHADATRNVLDADALLLAHARALSDSDFYHDRFPRNPNNPTPELGGMGMLLIGDAALRFADGDQREGLLRACTAALTWRRLALHADSRVVQAVAGRYYIDASRLVAGMRAELPADTQLPAACDAAFEPIADAVVDVCDVMKVEFANNAVALRQLGDPVESPAHVDKESRWSQLLGRLLTNSDAAVAYSAPAYASFCTRDADIQRDAERVDGAAPPTGCGVEGALFDPIGCTLVVLGNPRRTPPTPRMKDMQRMNILMRAAMAQGAAPAVGTAAQASVSGSTEGVTADAAKHALRIQRAFSLSGENPEFMVPLPASRLH